MYKHYNALMPDLNHDYIQGNKLTIHNIRIDLKRLNYGSDILSN